MVRVGNAVVLLSEWVDHAGIDWSRAAVRRNHEDAAPVIEALAPFAQPGGSLPPTDHGFPIGDLAAGLSGAHSGPRVSSLELAQVCARYLLTHPMVARVGSSDDGGADTRLVAAYASRRAAQEQLDEISELVATCPAERVEGGRLVAGRLPGGPRRVLTFGVWMDDGSAYAFGELFQVERVGDTLVVTMLKGEFSRDALTSMVPERTAILEQIIG